MKTRPVCLNFPVAFLLIAETLPHAHLLPLPCWCRVLAAMCVEACGQLSCSSVTAARLLLEVQFCTSTYGNPLISAELNILQVKGKSINSINS